MCEERREWWTVDESRFQTTAILWQVDRSEGVEGDLAFNSVRTIQSGRYKFSYTRPRRLCLCQVDRTPTRHLGRLFAVDPPFDVLCLGNIGNFPAVEKPLDH